MDRKQKKQNGIGENCRSRLASIVSQGLNPFPSCVFDLDVMLSASVVDLRKVDKALSGDVEFSRRVLHLSNVLLNRPKDPAFTIADAVVLLGPCLFHTAVLLCAVTEFGALEYRDQNAEALWAHSVQVAMLSEKIAEQSDYPARGAAYLAGLLHDIGYLPLLTVAREQEKAFAEFAGTSWRDNIDVERDIFGLDHCQIGRWMAKSWKFPQSLTDAICHHHDPGQAKSDSHLAEIVCAAEYLYSTSSDQANSSIASYVLSLGSPEAVQH